MWADDSALVAFDAVFSNPFRNVDSSGRAFILGSAGRECAVFHAGEGGNREIIAFLTVHDIADVLYEIRTFYSGNGASGCCVSPFFRNRYFNNALHACINSAVVHVNDILALLAVGVFVGFLQVSDAVFIRNDVGQMEECRLHDQVDASAKADFLCNFKCIDDVEFCVESSEFSLHADREDSVEIFFSPCGVQEEDAAWLESAEKVILVNVGWAVAGNVVCFADQVWSSDRIRSETEVGDCYAAGFLGIISEVALCIEVSVVADDLDGALVCADGAVRTEAPEFAGYKLAWHFRYRNRCQREVCHIVVDGQCKVVARCFFLEVFIDSHDVFRNNVLGTKAVTSAAYLDGTAGRSDGADNVKIQRFADGARFSCPVEDSNLLDCIRNLGQEMLDGERTEEVDVQYAYLFAMCIKGVCDIFADIRDRADGNDDAVSIRSTIVVKEVIFSAGDSADLVHVALNDVRKCIVIGVCGFAVLEVDIRIFCCAADDRVIRVQSSCSEISQCFLIDERSQFIIIQDFNLLDFMACTETIEEVDERNAAFDGSQMSDAGKIHDFLCVSFSQHSAAGSSCTHDILMIAKNGQSMVGQCTGSDMENARKKFASYFIHVWKHEEHALRCCIGSSQRTALQRAVECAGCAAFGLHFNNMYGVAENVFLSVCGPFVYHFSHRRRRGNWINSSYFCEGVGNIRSSCIAIHCFYFSHK